MHWPFNSTSLSYWSLPDHAFSCYVPLFKIVWWNHPSERPCKAHRSPNAAKSASLVQVSPLEGPARHIAHQTILNNAILDPLWSFPLFLTFNVRMKNGVWCTFSSWRFTLGNHQHAFQALLWHSSLFLTFNVRMKNGVWCTFSSWRVTLGTKSDDSRRAIKVIRFIYNALRKIRHPKMTPDFL